MNNYVNFKTALAAMRNEKIVQWDRQIFWIDKNRRRIVDSHISDIILYDLWIRYTHVR